MSTNVLDNMRWYFCYSSILQPLWSKRAYDSLQHYKSRNIMQPLNSFKWYSVYLLRISDTWNLNYEYFSASLNCCLPMLQCSRKPATTRRPPDKEQQDKLALFCWKWISISCGFKSVTFHKDNLPEPCCSSSEYFCCLLLVSCFLFCFVLIRYVYMITGPEMFNIKKKKKSKRNQDLER